MGEIVADRLVNSFKDLMGYDFTARMEAQLDSVANGDEDWKSILDNFYVSFRETLKMQMRTWCPLIPHPLM